jgi:hypothetical protein
MASFIGTTKVMDKERLGPRFKPMFGKAWSARFTKDPTFKIIPSQA